MTAGIRMKNPHLDATDPCWGFAFDGVTPDDCAWTNFLGTLAADGGIGILPIGASVVASAEALAVTTSKQIALRGAGPGLTKIRTSTAVDGLSITFTDSLQPPILQDLCLQTTALAAGTALTINGPSEPWLANLGPSVRGVRVRSEDAATQCWLNGITFNDCWYPSVAASEIKGLNQSYLPFSMKNGITYNNCQALRADHFTMFHLDTGIVQGGNVYGEGVQISHFEMVGVNAGVVTNGTPSIGTSIHDGHINAYSCGVKMLGHAGASIHDLLLFKCNLSSSDWIGVFLNQSQDIVVHHILAQGPGAVLAGSAVGVQLYQSNDNLIDAVSTDQFGSPLAYSVIVGTGSSRNTVRGTKIGRTGGYPAYAPAIMSDAGPGNAIAA